MDMWKYYLADEMDDEGFPIPREGEDVNHNSDDEFTSDPGTPNKRPNINQTQLLMAPKKQKSKPEAQSGPGTHPGPGTQSGPGTHPGPGTQPEPVKKYFVGSKCMNGIKPRRLVFAHRRNRNRLMVVC